MISVSGKGAVVLLARQRTIVFSSLSRVNQEPSFSLHLSRNMESSYSAARKICVEAQNGPVSIDIQDARLKTMHCSRIVWTWNMCEGMDSKRTE